jgi:hypothetical protein
LSVITGTVRLVDGSTVIWLRPNPISSTDAIFCSSHELTTPAPRTVTQPRSGRDGIDDLTTFHDDATFKAALLIQDDTVNSLTRHQVADNLRAICAPAKRPYLYIQRDGWLSERRCQLRAEPHSYVVDSNAVQRLLVSLQFSVPDGVLEDVNQSSVVIRPVLATIGRTYTKAYPWSYVSGSGGINALVTSAGSVSTPPLIRIYGACTDPTIRNLTTEQELSLSGITLLDGQYLEIDVKNRNVYLNGDPSLSYYNTLDFTTSSWWELQPGINAISASTTSQDASCELDLFWMDRWA